MRNGLRKNVSVPIAHQPTIVTAKLSAWLTVTCQSELLELSRRVGAAFSRTPYPHHESKTALTPPIHPQDRVATARQSTRPRQDERGDDDRFGFRSASLIIRTVRTIAFALLASKDEMHRHLNPTQPQLNDLVDSLLLLRW